MAVHSISPLTPINRPSGRKYTLTLNDTVNQINTLCTHTHAHKHTNIFLSSVQEIVFTIDQKVSNKRHLNLRKVTEYKVYFLATIQLD